ncbi:hypothetical protein FQR65_LT13253 [Abscondita terminalis]|nr:hypothetical protein FQR65_LT13253 [Abscondita terminalis]
MKFTSFKQRLHCPNPNEIVITLFDENVHNKKLKVQKYFTQLAEYIIVGLTCTIEPDRKWTLTCDSSDTIEVSGYLTHEHFDMDREESSNYVLPEIVAIKLKCNMCQAYLSCGPIKMQKNNYICGRCTVTKGCEVVMQPLFENAMANFTFPCKFDKEGCLQQIPFNSSQLHESSCIFRTLPCPALECTRTVCASKIYEHFSTCHSHLIIENNQIKLDLLTSLNKNLLINQSNYVAIVKYCFSTETKLLQFSVAPLIEKERRINNYQLHIVSGTDLNCSINLSPKPCHIHDSSFWIAGEHDEYDINPYTSIFNNPSFVFINISILFGGLILVLKKEEINCELVEELDEEFERATFKEIIKQKKCYNCKMYSSFCNCRHSTNTPVSAIKNKEEFVEKEKPSNYILPVDIVEKLKCYYCQGYLSCGPIKMENNQYICGRCTAKNNKQVALQPLFEESMVKFIFPCMYDKEGCLQRMLFNCTQDHETTCMFRTIRCPALTCTNTITASKLYQHFGKDHSDCIMKNNQIKLNLSHSHNQNLLMNESDSIVVAKYCFDAETKVLQFSIVPFVEKGRHIDKYKLHITSGIEADNSISLSSKPCHKHDSSVMLAGQYDEYNVENYTSILNSPSFLIVKILLLFGGNDSLCEGTGKDVLAPEGVLDDEFESRILDTVVAITCKNCKFLLCKCNSINYYRGQLGQPDRNDIPCKWKGCKETLSKHNMLSHVENCKYKLHICPFLEECEQGLFKLTSFFLNHLETHAQRCLNSNKIIIPLFNENIHYSKLKVQKYFTVLNDNIVRLNCTIYPDRKWELTCDSFVDIKVNAYVTHEHCRFIQKLNEGSGKSVTYKSSSFTYHNECFSQFHRLKAVLNIFSPIDIKHQTLMTVICH